MSTRSKCPFICDESRHPTTYHTEAALQPTSVAHPKCDFEPDFEEHLSPEELRRMPPPSHNDAVFKKMRSARMPAAAEYRPKLLCLTYTMAKSHAKSSGMYNTWGKECDRHILFTDKPPIANVPDKDVVEVHPPGEESYYNMWHKVLEIRKWVIKQWWSREYDYYFLSGDDALVHVSNMRRYFSEPQVRYMHESGSPLHLGYRHDSEGGNPFHSGAGYVFNAAAFHVWETFQNEPLCNPNTHSFAEDIFTALCHGVEGAETIDARDEFGHDRFQIFPPDYAIGQALNPLGTKWFLDFRDRPHPSGLDTVSRDAVMWHYIQEDRMKAYHAMFVERRK